MPVHRRITALLATLTAMAGGSFVTSAAADDAESGERGARTTLQSAPHDHATAHRHRAEDLARALGVSTDRLGAVLRELRSERRASDVAGARPAIRSASRLAEERLAYAAALAAKVGVTTDVAVAALDGATTRPAGPSTVHADRRTRTTSVAARGPGVSGTSTGSR